MTHVQMLRAALVFVAKWATAGLAFALVLVWLRPDLRHPATTPTPQRAAPASTPAPATTVTPATTTPATTFADAVKKSAPAVVNIYTARVVAQRRWPPELDRLFGDRAPAIQQRVEASLGSGVIVDGRGHIVTNHHVIAQARDIKLQLADGRIADKVRVVGVDPETDLAVLQIALDRLPVMRLGRSDTLRVGDVVLAIGNPYGLSQSVTQGIVSATGRDELGLSMFESYIQTDAAINLGNSGGALVNGQGELIGINTAMLGQNLGIEGISFAIPVNLVRGVVEQILRHGHVRRGWVGVGARKLDPARRAELGLPPNMGAEIVDVDANSPAERGGLKVGDVIVALNGLNVRSERDAMNRVAALEPGKRLRIDVRRGNEKLTFNVVIEERRL